MAGVGFGKKRETGFDHAKIGAMVEPLSVRVEKLVGGDRQPVDFPIKEGLPPGTGWTKGDVLGIETMVLELVGGGSFEGKIVDAGGVVMDWRFGYDGRVFPPKVSPSLASMAVQQPQASPFGAGAFGGFGGGGFVNPGFFQQPQQQQALTLLSGGGGHAANDRVSRLEEALAAERQSRQEERHRAEVERSNELHAREMSALRAEIAKSAESRKPAEDEQMRAVREELAKEREERRRMEERLERERSEQRAEERHRTEMQAIQAQIAALGQQVAARPDPMISFMVENSRQQAEVAKEIARNQESQLARVSSMTMQPAAILDLIDRKGHGADQLMNNMASAYNGLFDMFRKAIELQSGGPEHPAVGMIKDGIAAATDVAKRFAAAMLLRSLAAEQVKAVQAQTQAQVAMSRMAPQQLAGPPNGVPAQPVAAAPQPAAATSSQTTSASVPSGPGDEEMFGPALDQVKRLRLAVRQGMGPEDVVDKLMMGVRALKSQKIVVPAFLLLSNGQWGVFMEALLPDAPGALRDAVIALLQAPPESEGGEDEEEDEEDDDTDGDEAARA